MSPKYAVISVGKGNKYGHPDGSTLARLNSAGVQVYRTDLQGTIIATSDSKTVKFNKAASPIKEWAPDSSAETQAKPVPSGSANIAIASISLKEEVVIIKNNGNKDVDMTGWTLISEKGNQVYSFPQGYVLKAGAGVSRRGAISGTTAATRVF